MAPTPARHLATRCAAHATVATSRLLARHGAALAPAPMAAQPWRWRCAAPLVHCGSLTGAGADTTTSAPQLSILLLLVVLAPPPVPPHCCKISRLNQPKRPLAIGRLDLARAVLMSWHGLVVMGAMGGAPILGCVGITFAPANCSVLLCDYCARASLDRLICGCMVFDRIKLSHSHLIRVIVRGPPQIPLNVTLQGWGGVGWGGGGAPHLIRGGWGGAPPT